MKKFYFVFFGLFMTSFLIGNPRGEPGLINNKPTVESTEIGFIDAGTYNFKVSYKGQDVIDGESHPVEDDESDVTYGEADTLPKETGWDGFYYIIKNSWRYPVFEDGVETGELTVVQEIAVHPLIDTTESWSYTYDPV